MGNYLNCFTNSDSSECNLYRPKLSKSTKRKQRRNVSLVHPTTAPIFDDNFEMKAITRCYDEDDEKRVITRVKVVLTKKEAAQLLAKYMGGHAEMREYINDELRMAEERRRLGDGSSHGGWKPALASIHEDC